MTNIKQNVVRRHSHVWGHQVYTTRTGTWQTRAARRQRTPFQWERGHVSQSTVTLAFGLVMLVSVTLLGFVYLNQVFDTASQGADIQELQNNLVDLKEQQKALELEGAQLRSIQAVEEKVGQMDLEEAEAVAYLKTSNDKVALTR